MEKEHATDTWLLDSNLLFTELQRVLRAVPPAQIASAKQSLLDAHRVFFTGAGRSGLALKMAAMRFMHLGMQVYVAGEVTTPALTQGDLLIVASASGTTKSMLLAADVARKVQAQLLVITTAPQSELARQANGVVVLAAASKADAVGNASEQYAGSLFEQSVLLLFDSMFHSLWKGGTQTSDELLRRHANLE